MKAVINDGGSAFPRPVSFSEEGGTHRGTLGMTLRDYFAGQALTGLLSSGERSIRWEETIAYDSYKIADAMLVRKEASK